MHPLVIVDQTSRSKDALGVDDFIDAEFPDINVDPVLYDLVLQHMTHGPCGPKCQDSCHDPTYSPKSL